MVSWRNKNDVTVPLLDWWDICLFGPVVGSLVKFASNFCLSVVHLFCFFWIFGVGGVLFTIRNMGREVQNPSFCFYGGMFKYNIRCNTVRHIIYI